jgi:hypothetical protein
LCGHQGCSRAAPGPWTPCQRPGRGRAARPPHPGTCGPAGWGGGSEDTATMRSTGERDKGRRAHGSHPGGEMSLHCAQERPDVCPDDSSLTGAWPVQASTRHHESCDTKSQAKTSPTTRWLPDLRDELRALGNRQRVPCLAHS